MNECILIAIDGSKQKQVVATNHLGSLLRSRSMVKASRTHWQHRSSGDRQSSNPSPLLSNFNLVIANCAFEPIFFMSRRTRPRLSFPYWRRDDPILSCPVCGDLLEIPPVPANEEDCLKQMIGLCGYTRTWEDKWRRSCFSQMRFRDLLQFESLRHTPRRRRSSCLPERGM